VPRNTTIILRAFRANFKYTVIILKRLHTHRRSFIDILDASNVSRSRFTRLFLLSLSTLLFTVPVQYYMLYANIVNHTGEPFSWFSVHANGWEHKIKLMPSNGAIPFDRYSWVISASLVFLFFGTSREARATYSKWIKKAGLHKRTSDSNLQTSPSYTSTSITTILNWKREKLNTLTPSWFGKSSTSVPSTVGSIHNRSLARAGSLPVLPFSHATNKLATHRSRFRFLPIHVILPFKSSLYSVQNTPKLLPLVFSTYFSQTYNGYMGSLDPMRLDFNSLISPLRKAYHSEAPKVHLKQQESNA
jgi:hypothetical protein